MTSKKPRGRPAKTSREEILDAACEQLKTNPFDELSLSALARSMGLTPMALYRYFTDKNDLQQAIAERLMSSIALESVEGDSWQQQLYRWAMGLFTAFCTRPQLIQYMGWQGHIASAWIKKIARLAKVLKDAGVAEAQLPITLKWISSSVVGLIVIAVMRQRENVSLDESDLPSDDRLASELMPGLRADVALITEEALFEHHVRRLIDSIEQELATRAP